MWKNPSYYAMVFLAVFLSACGPKGDAKPPQPPANLADCKPACELVRQYDAAGDKDCRDMLGADGKPCEQWCDYYTTRRKVNPTCMKSSASCRAMDDCGMLRSVSTAPPWS